MKSFVNRRTFLHRSVIGGAATFSAASFMALPNQLCAHDAEGEEGFEIIFDADHTEDWQQAGPGGFTVEEGIASPHGGMGLWWYSGKSYGDFILRLEFNMERIGANSGIFCRFPDPEGDPWVAVRQAHEVQISGDRTNRRSTGAIYDLQAPTSTPIREAGEWNDYEIRCVGATWFVTLNGELINEYESDRRQDGYIGIQNHDDNSVVKYRNIRVKEL